MKVKFIQDEDFANYQECSLFIGMPFCDFKCERDCGIKCCQNSSLAKAEIKEISDSKIIADYLNNPFTSAVVFGGMEPLDSFDELINFISEFRKVSDDTIVIYTGYYLEEKISEIDQLKQFVNIIVKFGRFIPDAPHRLDSVLGIELASDNQYAEKIS